MNRKTPTLDRRSSVTPDAIDLKFGTRDYVVGATQSAKNRTIVTAGAPRQRGELNIMFKCFLFFIFLFFVILAQLWRTHFWEYRRRFCIKRRVPVGIDLLGGLNFKTKKFSPPKAPKT